MLFGGSLASWSVTSDARTVTVHVSVNAKLVLGSRVNVTGPPFTVAAWEPLVTHEIENQLAVTLTGSLNVTVTLDATGTSVASSAGFVPVTVGAASAGAATVSVYETSVWFEVTAFESPFPEGAKVKFHRGEKV
jgi:hypothetical protein